MGQGERMAMSTFILTKLVSKVAFLQSSLLSERFVHRSLKVFSKWPFSKDCPANPGKFVAACSSFDMKWTQTGKLVENLLSSNSNTNTSTNKNTNRTGGKSFCPSIQYLIGAKMKLAQFLKTRASKQCLCCKYINKPTITQQINKQTQNTTNKQTNAKQTKKQIQNKLKKQTDKPTVGPAKGGPANK